MIVLNRSVIFNRMSTFLFLTGLWGIFGEKWGYVGKKTWRYNFVYGKHVYFLKHTLQNNISTNRNTKKIMIFNWAGVQRAHTGRSHNRTFMRSEIFMLWRTGNEAGDTSVMKKWKWSRSVLSDSLQPHGLEPTGLLHPWDFSRQAYWSELPFPSPGDLPNPAVEPRSPVLQADALPSSGVTQVCAQVKIWVALDYYQSRN